MKNISLTHVLLAVIGVALLTIALRPYLAPEPVRAEAGAAYPLFFEPGTRLLRAPDGSQQVYGKIAIDLRNGEIWGFPTGTPDPYPVNPSTSKPQTAHPFLLGRYALEDINR